MATTIPLRFALVVPALNEEEAIESTLRRVLAARANVLRWTAVTEMVVVFVNDGSTDRTQALVDQPEFAEVIKVRFEHNRGYGAAIKAGWQAVEADLVGFIDADGTCDPEVCVDLVNRLSETGADVVLGARLTPGSRMPLVRKVGNRIFAELLGVVSGHELTDAASGFRVLRRSSLPFMTPLPDGLHFTPTMSAICLLDPRLRIEEVPFSYRERIGRSKLKVLRDGIRFLYTILFTACCYSPIKTMLGLALLGLLLSLGLSGAIHAATGTELATRVVMTIWVYSAALMMGTGVVCHQLNYLLLGPRQEPTRVERWLHRTLHHYKLITAGLHLLVVSQAGIVLLSWRMNESSSGWTESALRGLSITAIGGIALAMFGIITRVVWSVGQKQKALTDRAPGPTRELAPRTADAAGHPASTPSLAGVRPNVSVSLSPVRANTS